MSADTKDQRPFKQLIQYLYKKMLLIDNITGIAEAPRVIVEGLANIYIFNCSLPYMHANIYITFELPALLCQDKDQHAMLWF